MIRVPPTLSVPREARFVSASALSGDGLRSLPLADEVEAFLRKLLSSSSLSQGLNGFTEFFTQTLGIRSLHLLLSDDLTGLFWPARGVPASLPALANGIKADAPIVRFFCASSAPADSHERRTATPQAPELRESARRQLCTLGLELALPVVCRGGLTGLCLLGEKSSPKAYTMEDLPRLSHLTRIAGLCFEKALDLERRELIGHISRGLAHDMHNWLVPISTMLQLSAEGEVNREKVNRLLPKALQGLEGLQACLEHAHAYSQQQRPPLQARPLDHVLAQAVALAEGFRNDVRVVCQAPAGMLVDMDPVLICRLLTNLIANALQASPPGATVSIDLRWLPASTESRPWAQVRVSDNGPGIEAEHLPGLLGTSALGPAPTDGAARGGLGLAICRQIIALHGGRFNVVRQEPQGTTVEVDLPAKHSS